MGKRPKQRFIQRRHTDSYKHMKRCSLLKNIAHYKRKENQNYNEVITLFRSEWPSSINLQTNAGEGVKKRKPSCIADGDVNWFSHYGRWYGDSNKITIWPNNPTPRHIPWGNQNWKHTHTHTHTHIPWYGMVWYEHIPWCSLQHYLQ